MFVWVAHTGMAPSCGPGVIAIWCTSASACFSSHVEIFILLFNLLLAFCWHSTANKHQSQSGAHCCTKLRYFPFLLYLIYSVTRLWRRLISKRHLGCFEECWRTPHNKTGNILQLTAKQDPPCLLSWVPCSRLAVPPACCLLHQQGHNHRLSWAAASGSASKTNPKGLAFKINSLWKPEEMSLENTWQVSIADIQSFGFYIRFAEDGIEMTATQSLHQTKSSRNSQDCSGGKNGCKGNSCMAWMIWLAMHC